MGAHAEQQAEMHAQRPDVGARLAADPENAEVAIVVELDELALVDAPDTQLALDSRDQRRPLEQSAGQGLEGLGEGGLAAGNGVVETDDGNVFLSGSLLGLDETGRAVDTNNQASGDLGIEGPAVAGLFTSASGPLSAHAHFLPQGFMLRTVECA